MHRWVGSTDGSGAGSKLATNYPTADMKLR